MFVHESSIEQDHDKVQAFVLLITTCSFAYGRYDAFFFEKEDCHMRQVRSFITHVNVQKALGCVL